MEYCPICLLQSAAAVKKLGNPRILVVYLRTSSTTLAARDAGINRTDNLLSFPFVDIKVKVVHLKDTDKFVAVFTML